jgi:hypothetical protein
MAPPQPLFVLHEKKEEDSTNKHFTEALQYKAPPLSVDVIDLNKQFKTWTAPEGVCFVPNSSDSVELGLPVK